MLTAGDVRFSSSQKLAFPKVITPAHSQRIVERNGKQCRLVGNQEVADDEAARLEAAFDEVEKAFLDGDEARNGFRIDVPLSQTNSLINESVGNDSSGIDSSGIDSSGIDSSGNDSSGNELIAGIGLLRRIVYVTLGLLFLGLGLLGVILPGLPTTPFLLLMSFFLVRSSPRLHARVLRLPVVGKHLQDWETHRAIRPGVKRLAFAMIATAAILLLAYPGLPLYIKAIGVALIAVGGGVVWRLPVVAR